jgi:replicative DNA helicase
MSEWSPERLPQDPEAEQSLLATCCAPGGDLAFAEVIFGLSEDDFVVPKHRAVFRALKGLVEQQIEVHALTLKDALHQAGELTTVEGFAGLTELMAAPEVGRPQVLADLLRRKTKLRKLMRLGAGLAKQASMEEEAPDLLVDQAAEGLFRLAQGDNARRGLLGIEQVAGEAMQRIHDRLEGRHSAGVRVGMSTLDALTQGFQPGNLIVLAARPGIGKTALALNWLLRAALHHNICGAFFSLEMSHEEVFLRLLSSHAEINMKKVMAGHATPEEESRLYRSRDELIQLPIFISDQASITVPQIQNMVVKQGTQANRKVELIVVDYLQLMSSPENSRAAKQNEATRVGELSRGLKLLAKDHGVPVVVLSQLNREVEHRQGGRPQLSDLRDSGAIEQDADMVAFIHRKMVAVQEGQDPDPSAELVIAKHRNGPTRIIPLYFEADYATYHEMARETNPDFA